MIASSVCMGALSACAACCSCTADPTAELWPLCSRRDRWRDSSEGNRCMATRGTRRGEGRMRRDGEGRATRLKGGRGCSGQRRSRIQRRSQRSQHGKGRATIWRSGLPQPLLGADGLGCVVGSRDWRAELARRIDQRRTIRSNARNSTHSEEKQREIKRYHTEHTNTIARLRWKER